MKRYTVTNWVTVFSSVIATVIAASEVSAPIRFENEYASSGAQFTLENSPTPLKHLPETMAGGVAAFDYDGDGLTDLFFTNGAEMPSLVKKSGAHWNRLYRNEGGWR